MAFIFWRKIIFNALYAKEVQSLLALRENKVLEISSKAGNFLVESIDVTLNDIQRSVENGVANGEWDQVMILDSHGIVVAHSNHGGAGECFTK